MARPAPAQTGDLAHLTWGSTRWSIARAMRLVVITHEGPPPEQYVELLSGRDVVLTREQVAGFLPLSKRPTNVQEHEVWVLSGDDQLTPRRGTGAWDWPFDPSG
jgi:hypothetical protein